MVRASSWTGSWNMGILRLGAVDVPQIGAVDDRELEALAAVDGEHLDGLGVGLEAAAAVFVVLVFVRLVDPPAEPGRQRRRPEVLRHRLGMEELADVAQVGQESLAGGAARSTRRQVLGGAHVLQESGDPATAKDARPSGAATNAGPPTRLSAAVATRSPFQPMKAVRAAEAARSRAVGRSRASSSRSHSARRLGAEHAARAVGHRRHAGVVQGVADAQRLALVRTSTAR